MSFKFVESDLGSVLEVTCQDDSTGDVIDLTGSTVTLRFRIAGGTLLTKTMVLDADPTTGKVTYQFLAGELVPGQFIGDVTITDVGSLTISSLENIVEEVKARLS